jgi:hypothetical protein
LNEKIEYYKKLTQSRKLADGNVYNYESDDDCEKISLDELDFINKCEDENELDKETESPSKKIYKTKKSSNTLVK